MYLRSDSAAGVRFLAAVQERRGLKPAARAADAEKATGYWWLREAFLALEERWQCRGRLGGVGPLFCTGAGVGPAASG
jgi:hypothetical protein